MASERAFEEFVPLSPHSLVLSSSPSSSLRFILKHPTVWFEYEGVHHISTLKQCCIKGTDRRYRLSRPYLDAVFPQLANNRIDFEAEISEVDETATITEDAWVHVLLACETDGDKPMPFFEIKVVKTAEDASPSSAFPPAYR
jgi:hypothetical protein